MLTCGNTMGPMNAYKDMLDNMVSPITCVSMNHQNQLEQMTNGVMFATDLQLQQWLCLDTPAGLELELVSNSSSSSKLTLALEVFG
jgi:hypothetical protein